jgi:hypothetical protein
MVAFAGDRGGRESFAAEVESVANAGTILDVRNSRLGRIAKLGAAMLVGTVAAVGTVLGRGHAAAELKVGDLAPPFTLQGSDGRTYSLADYRGKQAVVLAWFPKAFTGG